MKTIKLIGDEKEILMAVLEASNQGMDIGEIRQAIKVIDVVEAADGDTDFEDADFAYLKERFLSSKFVKADRSIIALADKIETA